MKNLVMNLLIAATAVLSAGIASYLIANHAPATVNQCITVAALQTRGDGTNAIVLSGPKGCKVTTLEIQGSQWDLEHGGTPVIAIERPNR